MRIAYEKQGDTMVELTAATFGFGSRTLVRAATLAVARGEFCAIVGPLGAGQGTVLRLIAGELEPTRGTVRTAVAPTLVSLADGGVPLARALRGHGELVLIDALERPRGTVRDASLFLALHRLAGRGATVVAALGEIGPAIHLADRVILMREGEVVSDGSPHVVLVPKLLESVYAERPQPRRRRAPHARFRLHAARR